tara:strand:+ start:84 stop:1343 length:1260 start_codon:yes stop_codon:yes gene_type:complete
MLTEARIKKLTIKPRRYRVYDDRVTGLQVIVRPTGRKTFYLQTRIGGKLTDIKLVDVEGVSLRDARNLASEKLIELRNRPTAKDLSGSKTLGRFIEEQYKPYLETAHANPKASIWILETCFKNLLPTKMKDLSLSHIQQWRNKQSKLAPATINRRVGALRAACEKARLWGFIDQNPLTDWQKVRVPKEPVDFLSEPQIAELLEVLGKRDAVKLEQRASFNHWRLARGKEPYPDYGDYLELTFTDYLTPLVKLVLNTGLRFGEAIGLKWTDISDDDVLTARSSKTGNFRYIPLISETQSNLTGLKRLNKANAGFTDLNSLNENSTSYISNNIFVNPETGQPLKSVKTAWNGVRSELSFNCDFRMLRRTFGSRLITQGVPVYHVSQLLGHTNVETTQRWYLSLKLDAYKEAVRSIDDFLKD